MIGVHWDISWHQSIGRDTFWTPAHLAIHLCGVLAGVACAYLILSTTARRESSLRTHAVRIWGFWGPLGAFIAAWGGIAMLTSAPFDNWWHNAYGLDVKILSPPHMVLAAGIIGVEVGALILILGYMNRAAESERGLLLAMFLYVGGMILVCLMILELELTMRPLMHRAHFYRAHSVAFKPRSSRPLMHRAHFYRVVATAVPLVLAVVARGARYRWAATVVAGVYTLFIALVLWILPLFPAEPKLGPVYHQVTQFTPPEFPLLLIAPAFLLDLVWQRTGHWGAWKQSVVSAMIFLVAFALVQWPFADFLMSPAARNWFFGTKYFGYNTRPDSIYARYLFVRPETAAVFWQETGLAFVIAAIGIRLGIAGGDQLQRIRR